jgi:hypothetical protein
MGKGTVASSGVFGYYGGYDPFTYIVTGTLTLTTSNVPSELDNFKEDEQTFLEMRDDLVKNPTYRGKFVAILDKKLIDVDSNEGVLAERCYRKWGYKPIYIAKVERIKRTINLPSPQRVR